MVTEVRQRVTRDQLGRRGTIARPGLGEPAAAAHRRRAPVDQAVAPADGDASTRNDPTKEIGAAWAVKERLRMLLAEREPSKIRWRLADFYDAAIDAQLPEATRLASTIQTWWPAILVALTERRHQRPHRRLQPDHQTGQTSRLRLPEHDQLPTPYPDPHRGHPTAKISSMNRSHPAQIRRAPKQPNQRSAPDRAASPGGHAYHLRPPATSDSMLEPA